MVLVNNVVIISLKILMVKTTIW